MTANGLPCPVCRTNLVMAERQGIEIDHCPNCRGIWLDRGELDKIIERSSASIAPSAPAPGAGYAPQPQFDDRSRYPDDRRHHDDRHGHGYKPKRRKSFLEELFD
ncbi:zf-TFIIB domain-containing protein [Sphingomonas sp. HF-S3]|jgi:Zn-finger nucleic acid-binding protein|uniref:Zf-TFIIB domain-containing protein n=1 Tax=Sphingomonas rustica TaxID=3103142 RepID=A0ABV0B6K7_9SPHN